MNERTINTSVRLPARLHDRLRQQAAREDRSSHYLILRYIERGLREDERRAAEEGEQS